GETEQLACARVGEKQLALDVDDELRGRILVERDFPETGRRSRHQRSFFALRIARQETLRSVLHANLHEDALLQIRRREGANEVQKHLRLAEHQESTLAPR